jgi:hypothetical protein
MTLVHEQTSLTTPRWICPDGSSFESGTSGTCPEIWQDYWQQGRLPAYLLQEASTDLASRYDGARSNGTSVPGVRCTNWQHDVVFPASGAGE